MPTLADKNILVAGGAGFIGSHLVNRIICESPAKIVIVDNFFLGREENLASAKTEFNNLKIERMDASDFPSMRDLVDYEHIDVVFNLAVIPLPASLKCPAWTVNANINITTTFCELARLDKIKTLVHCSSSEAYGSAEYIPMDEKHPLAATTPYAASKAACDLIVHSYYKSFNIDMVIVRPFNNFGPRQNSAAYAGIIPILIQRIKSGQPIEIYGNGEQTRDYIYVKNTVDAIVKMYNADETRGKSINIATGREISINELVNKVLKVMGYPNYPIVHSTPRIGEVLRHMGDITLAHQLVGFKPEAITDEQIRETVDWYLEGKCI